MNFNFEKFSINFLIIVSYTLRLQVNNLQFTFEFYVLKLNNFIITFSKFVLLLSFSHTIQTLKIVLTNILNKLLYKILLSSVSVYSIIF